MTLQPSRNRSLLLGAAALAAVTLPAAPAQALPGLELNAGLYGAYNLVSSSASPSAAPFGADLDAYIGTPIFKASGHLMSMGGGTVGEAVLRFEPIPLPVVGIRPGIGYQGNTLFKAGGALDHAPYASLLVNAGIPLLPVSFDAEVGASYPLGLGQPVFAYTGGVNVFVIPLLPVAISGRYRGYALGTGFTPALGAVEGGLRVSL